MSIENNKMQVDIDNLFKQNVNDLCSIKELYKRIEEIGEKITQIKYVDNTLVKKLKKEYEKLQKIILDENVQIELNNKIEETKTLIKNKVDEFNLQLNYIDNKYKTIKISNKLKNYDLQVDATNIIQECLNDLSDGGTLIVDCDFSIIANNPTINKPKRILITNNNIKIVGENNSKIYMKGLTKEYLDSIDDKNSSGRDVFTVFSFLNVKNCEVKNIEIIGEWNGKGVFRYQSPRTKGIGFLGCEDCVIDNVRGKNIHGNLINITPADADIDGVYKQSKRITISNCYAEYCLENGFNNMGNTDAITYYNCHAKYCGSAGIELGGTNGRIKNCYLSYNQVTGVSISSNYGIIDGCLISNSTGHDNMLGSGIIISSGNYYYIKNNFITDCTGIAIQIYPNTNNFDISNNMIINNCTVTNNTQNSIINVVGTSTKIINNGSISNNIIDNSQNGLEKYGLNLGYCSNVRVENNNIKSNNESTLSIYVHGTSNKITLKNNVLNKNISSTLTTTPINVDNIGDQYNAIINSCSTTSPTSGNWKRGDFIRNSLPTVSGNYVILGWICTQAGEPGTWYPAKVYVGN